MPTSTVARMLAPATTALAVAQPVVTQAHRISGRARPDSEEAAAFAGPLTPPAGAFIIWLPLFVSSAVFGRGLQDPRRQDHTELATVEGLAATAFAADAAWSLTAQYRGLGWPSLALIGSAASSAIMAMVKAARHAHGSEGMRFAARWIGGLAGWLSVATFANIETTLNRQLGRPSPSAETRRAVALVSAAGILASVVAIAGRGNGAYAAGAGWGLGGVVVKALRQGNRPVLAAGAAAGAALLAATLTGRAGR